MGAEDLVFLSRQLMSVLSAHTKTVTSQGPVFAQSSEQGTDNPRVGTCVLTVISLNSESSDLVGACLCWVVLGLRFYSCQAQAKPNKYETE